MRKPHNCFRLTWPGLWKECSHVVRKPRICALQMESLWLAEEQTLPCHTAAQLGYPDMAHKGEAVPRCREQNREHQARKARGPYASRLL